jgi:NAD(P)-dependent dehydrogenase (short-subunit alcohol dehydrogenase family)
VTARDLEGAVAVVTGAGRGFGRAIGERLGAAGAHVCLIARSGDELESVADTIRSGGGSATAYPLDVTDRSAVEATFADIDRDPGPVSILVNNAGTLDAIGPFWEIDPDEWWREVEIHLRGTVLFSYEALARMVPRGSGRIINIVGLLGQRGEPYSTAYTCAKAAMYRMTECLAAELKDVRIPVFCMSPGPVRTNMTGSLVESDEGRRWLPEFADLSDDEWVPPDVGADLAHRLARGDADALSGRALHVAYDLDELIAEADTISSDRFVMRITP